MKIKSGFTLAEVLITMVIVGAVAAMTIPTLNYQRLRKEYSTKLKHFYSRMDNALAEMEADKGSLRDMALPSNANAYQWYLDNIDPYLGHAAKDDSKNNSTDNAIYFKDGSALGYIHSGDCFDIAYDVNGDKMPNELGRDKYRFLICFNDTKREFYFGSTDKIFGPYAEKASIDAQSRDSLKNACASRPILCAYYLMTENWEFKSDYPYSF